jgi:glycosyltransferase involved in cell wall biosynthesis
MMQAPSSWRAQIKPRLLIVGAGSLKEQIQWIARELDLQESVKFLGLHYNVIHLLQQAWGFVLPSRWEGLPNALLEAMACGLPCIATRVSGSEDLIQNDVNGLLVENEQPADMARALQRIIMEPELAQRLGNEARATIIRDYQIAHVTQKTVEFYHHILDKGTQPLPFALKDAAE